MASRQGQKTTSLKDLISKYKKQLPISELESLMAFCLHKNIEYIYKNPEKKLSRSSIKSFEKLVKKRIDNWSLAHIKKQKDFFGTKFALSKYTLMPRPESELIIEEALKYSRENQNIIDIGTGSGALILSLAKNNKHKSNYTATDISSKVLTTAKTNARKLKLKNKINFIKSDLFKNIQGKFDIIVANLPYLTNEQMKEASIKKEPRSALVSGQDGLNHYKKLLQQVPKYIKKEYLILLEIDPKQKEKISKEIKINLPEAKIKFIKDLAKNIRLVKITN